MNWYQWRWRRIAYAPGKFGEQRGHGFRWVPLVFGLYVAISVPGFTPKRHGSGEWITGRVESLRTIGFWILCAWIVVGWLIFIPGWLYLQCHT